MIRLFAIIALVVLVGFAALPVRADGECAGTAETVAALALSGFSGHSGGPMMDGRHVTVYVHDNGTWFAVVFHPAGLACIAARGVGWGMVEAEL